MLTWLEWLSRVLDDGSVLHEAERRSEDRRALSLFFFDALRDGRLLLRLLREVHNAPARVDRQAD
jgi:hypothetical protein